MKKPVCISILTLVIILMAGTAANAVSIIPQPSKVEAGEGEFTLSDETAIVVTEDTREIGKYLAGPLNRVTGLDIEVRKAGLFDMFSKQVIVLKVSKNKKLGDEGYKLKVTKDRIEITGNAAAGVFYGVQSLRQLLPAEIESKSKVEAKVWSVPVVEIEDVPRFQWRGLMLDSSRHFLSVDFVKRYIDLLAYHKMNRLHWHLTDNQGWRVEIKRYPKLTQIGAWRNSGPGDLVTKDEVKSIDHKLRYGGYYTQQEMKDIVAYAKRRYVMVVPEIEMPGHSLAALASYPNLGCTGGPYKVLNFLGTTHDIFCVGNEEVFEFMENVLTEVVELFDAPYIHIGGDEAPRTRVKECPKCQARAKAEGLERINDLQTYMIKRIEKFLQTKDRRIIGWDEILEGGPAPGAIVQSWRGTKGATAATKLGMPTIVSPTSHCYLDYPQDQEQLKVKPDWMKYLPVEKVYSFEPVPEGFTAEQEALVLGSEGCMWTEFTQEHQVDSMVFPRMTALAEVLWSPKELRDWDGFLSRLKSQFKRYDVMGVDYHKVLGVYKAGDN